MPSLLALPPELRVKVYRSLFLGRTFAVHRGNHCGYQHRPKSSISERDSAPFSAGITNILLVCRTITTEISPMFLAASNLILRDCKCWQQSLLGLPDVPISLTNAVFNASSIVLKTRALDSHAALLTFSDYGKSSPMKLDEIDTVFDLYPRHADIAGMFRCCVQLLMLIL